GLFFCKRPAADIQSHFGVRPHRSASGEILKAMSAKSEPLSFKDRDFYRGTMGEVEHGNSLRSDGADTRQWAILPSSTAPRNPLSPCKWNRRGPPVCRSLRTCRGHSSTPGRPGMISSLWPPLRGWDGEGYRSAYCFSPAHPPGSNKRRSSCHAGRKSCRYGCGSAPADLPTCPASRGKCGVRKQ